MRKINILILGVGGNVSQGIIKALKESNINCRILGACIDYTSAGLYMCDDAFICPYANSNQFIPWLKDICNNEAIDIVLTGVEENILAIAENVSELEKDTNTIFKFTSYEKLLIGQNKLSTCKWLAQNGLNYPKYCSCGSIIDMEDLVSEVGYPLIAKPIIGKGSIGVFKVSNYEELVEASKYENYIIQECIGDESQEYTVGCYCNKKDVIEDVIILHRELKNGMTHRATVVDNLIIEQEVKRICKKFKPVGPLNVQLRLDKNMKPVCFELNVRFSGTTPMRAKFGFRDVEAFIKEYVFDEVIESYFDIRKGSAYRYISELYVFDRSDEELNNAHLVKDISSKAIEY